MANANQPPVSFDELIQEGRRKRKAEALAQEIFGKGRRSSAPPSGPKAGMGGSLASRVGVNKRTPSIPRSNTPRQSRPAHLSRPPTNEFTRTKPSYTQPIAPPASEAKSNGYVSDAMANGGNGLSIKGAASGPFNVVAQNFMPGTTAADIESVMLDVGGQMTSCRVVASNPTVIAEMAFVERAAAERVIDTFNGKKADGRPLYVYWKSGGGASRFGNQSRQQPPAPEEPPTPAFGAGQGEDMVMEVDENAQAREVENRLREERRGRDEHDQRDVFPSGPRDNRAQMDYYDRRTRRPEPGYQDGRYGFRGGYRDSGRGGYRRDDRRYGGGGQSWRP